MHHYTKNLILSIFFAGSFITCASDNGRNQDTKEKEQSIDSSKNISSTLLSIESHSDSLQSDSSSDWKQFIALFPDTAADSLQLYMYEAWIEKIGKGDVHHSISKKNYAENLIFKGKAIDPKFTHFVKLNDLEHKYNQDIQYYAVNSISLDSGKTCMLIRLYNESAPHIIDFLYLYVFDENHNLTDKIMVADIIGDEASSEQVQSWILDLNKDGVKEIVTRHEVTNYDDETEEKIVTVETHKLDGNLKFIEDKTISKSGFKKRFRLRNNGAVYH